MKEVIYFIRFFVFSRNKWAKKRCRKVARQFFQEAVAGAEDGAVAIDCGANVGKITGVLLESGFSVHAFEPDPVAAKVLVAKHGDNPKLSFHPCAVGADQGRVKLFRKKGFIEDPVCLLSNCRVKM